MYRSSVSMSWNDYADDGIASACRRGDRRSVIDADAAEARQLHGGVPQVEPGDQPEEIELDAFDPSDLDPEEAEQRNLDAGAAVGQAGVEAGAEVLADGVRRQRGRKLGHRPQHRRNEGVAVRSRPDAIVAVVAVAVFRDRAVDLRDHRFGGVAPEIDQHAREV